MRTSPVASWCVRYVQKPAVCSSSSTGNGWVCHSGSPWALAGPRTFAAKKRPGRHAEPVRPEHHGKARMIGQVAANRKVRDDVYPKRTQPFGRADAGAVQDGRAVVDAGADDDLVCMRGPPLFCRIEICDALGAVAFEKDPIDMAAGADGQIWPRAGGPDIGHERAEPDLFIAVVRHRPDDARMGVERIEVRRFAHAELETRVIHGAVDGRPALRPIALDDDRPIAAVDRVSAEIDVVFDGDEQRQQVRPRPAFISPRGPAIEIEWRAARRDRCVHHRRAADQAPARHAQASAAATCRRRRC